MNFKDLGLDDKTIQAIEDLGYTEPTTVQKDIIPSILAGKDIFTIAPTSCGKTCSYIFPLIDIISKKEGKNILIIAADSKESVNISDKFSLFNKYHEKVNLAISSTENDTNEDNVIIGSPDLLLENLEENNITLSDIQILVIDDINLIKKKRQLKNLNKILEILPSDKQNIVFTTRRSKEIQDILDKILKTPAEIKVDKSKGSETPPTNQDTPTETKVVTPSKKSSATKTTPKYKADLKPPLLDKRAQDLSKRYKVFGKKTPTFLLRSSKLANEDD